MSAHNSAAVDILIAMYREYCATEILKDETVVKLDICPSELNNQEDVTAELS